MKPSKKAMSTSLASFVLTVFVSAYHLHHGSLWSIPLIMLGLLGGWFVTVVSGVMMVTHLNQGN